MAHTSLPGLHQPSLSSARSLVVVSDPVGWSTRRDQFPLIPTVLLDPGRSQGATPQLRSDLSAALTQSAVGVRIVAIGGESLCYDVLSISRAAGAVDDEVYLQVEHDGRLRVFCTHCRTDGHYRGSVGDTINCRGCERSLVIHHHFSRRKAAHLGYMADAEETAGSRESAELG